jgi:hypothetical protein
MSHHHVKPLNGQPDFLEFTFSHCVIYSSGKNIVFQPKLLSEVQILKGPEFLIEFTAFEPTTKFIKDSLQRFKHIFGFSNI